MSEEKSPDPNEPSACSLPSHAETTAQESFAKTDEEWKKQLTPEQYHVMRAHGTEPPFQNEFWDNKDKGRYLCAGCLAPLFDSDHKYESGTGWPSYYKALEPENVAETVDRSYGMLRTEVHCARCGGHLGHVFPDGPRPTGTRYCINSASLLFEPRG